MATIYEAKTGSEFGGHEELYRRTEAKAKGGKVGLWQEDRSVWGRLLGKKTERESPRE